MGNNVVFYTEQELQHLKEIEKEILVEIIKICDNNDIPYFTVGGTTLGVVRHKGFIPWDDDIDIGMMRKDYNKFMMLASRELPKEYTLCHYTTDKNHPNYFAKIRKNGTQFVEENNLKLKTHKGIFVDIMVYDKVPEDDKIRLKHNKKVMLLQRLFINKSTTIPFNKNNIFKFYLHKLIKEVVWLILLPISKQYLFNKLDILLQKYNDTDSNMVSSRGFSEFDVKYSDIFPLKKAMFEDIEVNIPNNWDVVLTKQYGNYMQLPPENQRQGHRPILLSFGDEIQEK